MAMPGQRTDREYGKFRDAAGPGQSRVAVTQEGAFAPPAGADAFTVELANGDLDVVYKFRSGGVSGTVLATVTLRYATPQVLDLTQGTLT